MINHPQKKDGEVDPISLTFVLIARDYKFSVIRRLKISREDDIKNVTATERNRGWAPEGGTEGRDTRGRSRGWRTSRRWLPGGGS